MNNEFLNSLTTNEIERIKKSMENFDEDNNNELALEINDKIAGFIKYSKPKDENFSDYGEINALYFLDEHKGNGYPSEALEAVSNHLLENSGYYLVECSCNELNTQSSKVMLKAGFKKDGYIKNRRLNKDGTYSGVEYYSKTKK